VYVIESARNQGVFASLFRHAETLAGEAGGVCGLRLYVHDSNDKAVAVYRRMGMHDGHYRVMEVDLPPASAQ
jgi:ribosomal protein S18 acetylase RimI-like enzyme